MRLRRLLLTCMDCTYSHNTRADRRSWYLWEVWSERKASGSGSSSSGGSSSRHKAAVPTGPAETQVQHMQQLQQQPSSHTLASAASAASSSAAATTGPAPPSSSYSSFGAYKAVSRAFGIKLPSATSPLSYDDGPAPTGGGSKPVFAVGSPTEEAEAAALLEAFLAMIGRTETACFQVNE